MVSNVPTFRNKQKISEFLLVTKQNPVQQNEVPQTNSFIQRQLLTVQFLLYSDKKMSASAIDVWKSKQSLGKSSPEKGCKVIKLMEPSPIQNLLRKREK